MFYTYFLILILLCNKRVSTEKVPCECSAISCMTGSKCDLLEDGTIGCKPIDDVCSSVTCPERYVCIPDVKNCFTEPCPQYRCINITEPCITSGCSNELCSDEETVSPCIWKDEFACITAFGTCQRGTNGTCFWHYGVSNEDIDEYHRCVVASQNLPNI